jgi:hypothetical protein
VLHSLIPVHKPALWSISAEQTLLTVVSVELLDRAVDAAARLSQATIAEYVAAPMAARRDDRAAIEVAVECFVPPAEADELARRFEHALQQRSPAYAAGRMDGRFDPAIVHMLPAGVFHQWRHVWRLSEQAIREGRWTLDRGVLDGVLDQAARGWREVAVG